MTQTPKPETQKQRWIKYGANVVLTVIVVIALASLITYLAQRFTRRIDTTASGAYSLKPQTVNIIQNLKSPVRIVSLYSKPTTPAQTKEETDYDQVVSDLLREYARKGKNIDVETIDPVAEPSKADALYDYVRDRYGGELAKYKTFLEAVPGRFDQIKKLATDEQEKLKAVPEQSVDPQLNETMGLVKSSLTNIGVLLDDARQRVDRILKQKRPDYKLAIDVVTDPLTKISEFADQIDKELSKGKSTPGIPAPTTQYIAQSSPRYAQMKKLADNLLDELKKLGELKLDDVREKLRERDAVLVMGDKEMRSLSFDQLWQPDNTLKKWGADDKIKPRFAGEQQITTALLSLTDSGKKKVAFIRPGGAPLTTPEIFPFQRGGPLSAIADRLRNYNFDVVEKDLSGQYAMQAQMQGMPPAPEPSDEELKNAIWVVLDLPAGDQRTGPPPRIGPKLAEHLKAGGSAMVLTLARSEDLADALKDWGVQTHPDTVAIHEVPKMTGAASSDLADNAQRYPYVFVINKYGDHMLTAPVQSLDMLLVQVCPVTTASAADVKATPLIPIPDVPPSWGERDLESLDNGDKPAFNKDTDMPPPLWAGAALEKNGAGRLVVFGSLQSLTTNIVDLPDVEASKAQRRLVLRFPANGEFFANAIFWLANRETLIAISPQAMDVPRIAQMSTGALNAWRVGLLLVGLPGLVIAAGLMVFFARRD